MTCSIVFNPLSEDAKVNATNSNVNLTSISAVSGEFWSGLSGKETTQLHTIYHVQ